MAAAAGANAQWSRGADGKPMFRDDEDPSTGFRERVEKLRIQKEQKDFEEMLGRGGEAAKISSELAESFAQKGALTEDDVSKLAKVEKIVKKIRDGLGGDTDDTIDNDESLLPASNRDVVTELRSESISLFDQLKKTTRFTVSAAAITSSNRLLRIIRLLKVRQ